MMVAARKGYRCYFIGPDGRIAGRVEFEAEDDDRAVVEAGARYAQSKWQAGFEVWDLTRLVYRANS